MLTGDLFKYVIFLIQYLLKLDPSLFIKIIRPKNSITISDVSWNNKIKNYYIEILFN
jgi:hypothetical protein